MIFWPFWALLKYCLGIIFFSRVLKQIQVFGRVGLGNLLGVSLSILLFLEEVEGV